MPSKSRVDTDTVALVVSGRKVRKGMNLEPIHMTDASRDLMTFMNCFALARQAGAELKQTAFATRRISRMLACHRLVKKNSSEQHKENCITNLLGLDG
jgi:hypothetical protein